MYAAVSLVSFVLLNEVSTDLSIVSVSDASQLASIALLPELDELLSFDVLDELELLPPRLKLSLSDLIFQS